MSANCDPKVDFSELAADVAKGAAGFCGGATFSTAAGASADSGSFAGTFGGEDCVGAGLSSAAAGAAFLTSGAVCGESSDLISRASEFTAGATGKAFTGVSVASAG